MDSLKFVAVIDGGGQTVSMRLEGPESLMEVLGAFEQFLRGCGYVFDGNLDFVIEGGA